MKIPISRWINESNEYVANFCLFLPFRYGSSGSESEESSSVFTFYTLFKYFDILKVSLQFEK